MERVNFQLNDNEHIEILIGEDEATLNIKVNGETHTYPVDAPILELWSAGIFKAVKGDIEGLYQDFQNMKSEKEYSDGEENEYY